MIIKKKFYNFNGNSGTGVCVPGKDSLYEALSLWKKKVKMSGKLQQVFENKFFKKPSEKRREIVENAKYKQRKEVDKNRVTK